MTKHGLFGFAVALWLVAIALEAPAQGMPEKDQLRIGYADRAVAHSDPFVAKEAGFFAEEKGSMRRS
jgi:ABC-type nitrate/sulfonate/bicarbonate transport system substrate-binding protein